MNLGAAPFFVYFLIPIALYYFITKGNQVTQNLRNTLFDGEAKKLFFGKVGEAKAYLICAAFVFFGIALIRPQFGYQEISVERVGQDIAFVVDVSQSMLAKDLSPNRLGRVRFAITDLLSQLKGDRVGLISFAGVSFIESPLTYDYSTFRLFLDDLSPDLIPIPGTNIESALRRAIQLYGGKEKKFISGRGKSVILFSDGEELAGNIDAVTKELKELGIQVYTVGLGSEVGAPIPAERGYKRDRQGKVVLSKLDRKTLEKIATDTDGAYLGGQLSGPELESFFREKISSGKERSKISGGVIRVWNEYYQIALLLGLACYLISAVNRKNLLAVILLLSLIVPREVRAEPLDDANTNFEEGNFGKALDLFQSAETGEPPYLGELGSAKSLYKLKRFSEAKKRYSQLIEKEKKPEFLYNLGNSQTQLGEYKEAIESYQQALALNPNDVETRQNLEYVKKLLQQESNSSSSSSSASSQNSSSQSSTSEQKGGGGGGGSSNQSSQNSSNQSNQNSQSDQNSASSDQSSKSSKDSSSSSNSSSASGGEKSSASSQNNSNKSSSSRGGKSDSSSSASSSASSKESSQGQASSESSASSKAKSNASQDQSQDQLPSDRQEMLYDSVQEDRGALRKYRQQKAIEELEENQESPPEKDW